MHGRGAKQGIFSAVSIPSPTTTTTIARNGSANDSSSLHRFSRSISALPIQLDKSLSLLDWTGRQLRAASQGPIPTQLAPILERLGIVGVGWIESVRQFGRRFKTAVGRPDAAGGPRCTQGHGLAPGQQQHRCPGLSIAGRSVTERTRPTSGQHALHRQATPRLFAAGLGRGALPWTAFPSRPCSGSSGAHSPRSETIMVTDAYDRKSGSLGSCRRESNARMS